MGDNTREGKQETPAEGLLKSMEEITAVWDGAMDPSTMETALYRIIRIAERAIGTYNLKG